MRRFPMQDDSPGAWAVRRRRRMLALGFVVLAAATAVPATLHWAVLRIHRIAPTAQETLHAR